MTSTKPSVALGILGLLAWMMLVGKDLTSSTSAIFGATQQYLAFLSGLFNGTSNPVLWAWIVLAGEGASILALSLWLNWKLNATLTWLCLNNIWASYCMTSGLWVITATTAGLLHGWSWQLWVIMDALSCIMVICFIKAVTRRPSP